MENAQELYCKKSPMMRPASVRMRFLSADNPRPKIFRSRNLSDDAAIQSNSAHRSKLLEQIPAQSPGSNQVRSFYQNRPLPATPNMLGEIVDEQQKLIQDLIVKQRIMDEKLDILRADFSDHIKITNRQFESFFLCPDRRKCSVMSYELGKELRKQSSYSKKTNFCFTCGIIHIQGNIVDTEAESQILDKKTPHLSKNNSFYPLVDHNSPEKIISQTVPVKKSLSVPDSAHFTDSSPCFSSPSNEQFSFCSRDNSFQSISPFMMRSLSENVKLRIPEETYTEMDGSFLRNLSTQTPPRQEQKKDSLDISSVKLVGMPCTCGECIPSHACHSYADASNNDSTSLEGETKKDTARESRLSCIKESQLSSEEEANYPSPNQPKGESWQISDLSRKNIKKKKKYHKIRPKSLPFFSSEDKITQRSYRSLKNYCNGTSFESFVGKNSQNGVQSANPNCKSSRSLDLDFSKPFLFTSSTSLQEKYAENALLIDSTNQAFLQPSDFLPGETPAFECDEIEKSSEEGDTLAGSDLRSKKWSVKSSLDDIF